MISEFCREILQIITDEDLFRTARASATFLIYELHLFISPKSRLAFFLHIKCDSQNSLWPRIPNRKPMITKIRTSGSAKVSLAVFSALLTVVPAFAGPVLIDSFTTAYTSVTAGGNLTTATNNPGFPGAGTQQYGYTSDASILGGQRQVAVRDGHSANRAAVSINTGLGVAQLWGNASAMEQWIMYGSAIDFRGNGPGTGSALNLNLSLTDTFQIDVLQFSNTNPSLYVGMFLFGGQGGFVSLGSSILSLGTSSFSLASFSGANSSYLSDIDGIMLQFSQRGADAASGARIGEVRIGNPSASSVPETGSMALFPIALGALLVVSHLRQRESNRH